MSFFNAYLGGINAFIAAGMFIIALISIVRAITRRGPDSDTLAFINLILLFLIFALDATDRGIIAVERMAGQLGPVEATSDIVLIALVRTALGIVIWVLIAWNVRDAKTASPEGNENERKEPND